MQVKMRELALPAAVRETARPQMQTREKAMSGNGGFALALALVQTPGEQKFCLKDNPDLLLQDQENLFLFPPAWFSPVVADLQWTQPEGEKIWLLSNPPGGSWNGHQVMLEPSPGLAGSLAGDKLFPVDPAQAAAGEIPGRKAELPGLPSEPAPGGVSKEAIPLPPMPRQESGYAALSIPVGEGQGAKLVDLSQPPRIKVFEPGPVAENKEPMDAGSGMSLSLAQREQSASSLGRPAVSSPVSDLHTLSHQLVDRARLVVSEGRSELEVQLKPEHLGRLRLSLTLEDGVVTARFAVENPRVGQLIEAHLNHLRTVLSEAGLRFEQASVNVGGEAFNGFNKGKDAPSPKTVGLLTQQDTEDPMETGRVAALGINLLA
ncbi:MAG: flagellar hook-length control protein FliK [Bacillota bacterium]